MAHTDDKGSYWYENEVDECGCCCCYHPRDFYGDCRDDRYRLAIGDGWPVKYRPEVQQ